MLGFYKSQGLFEEVSNGTAGLAELLGCEEQTIKDTLAEYANACDQKICQKTGKTVFPSKVTEKDQSFVVARITPCIHYCMGGRLETERQKVLQCFLLEAVSYQ